ncbi:MAG: sulfatase-like hydrolase/transferase [Lentisphaeria bacterium]|nr:sulfatase-like hydrolase/transferase [Lentisphaeria bacterium]
MVTGTANVLLLLLDQVRADAIGCYGSPVARTPNIDRIANGGIRFDRGYTTISICSPARASMFSGLLSHRHGMLYNTTPELYGRTHLAEGVTLLGTILRQHGVRCGYAGKWHIDQPGPRAHGFEGTEVAGFGLPGYVPEYDQWLKAQGHPGQRAVVVRDYHTPNGVVDTTMPPPYGFDGIVDLPTERTPAGFVASRAIDLLREMGSDRFFLTASFWGPHHPALPNAEFAGMHDPATVDPWPNFRDDLSGKPRIQRRYRDCLNPNFSGTDWETWRRTVARHHDFLSMIDTQIGRILDELEALGLAENTTVLFTADHGDTLGCHGGQFDKGPYMFEETYRVPLLTRFADGAHAGACTDSLATNMDLFATTLDLLGVESPRDRHAVSLAAVHDDHRATFRDCIVGHFNGFDRRGMYLQRMLHTGRWKYVFNPGDFDEVYDLQADPYELHNIVDEPGVQGLRRDLAGRLVEEMERTEDPHASHAAVLMGVTSTF